MFGGYDYDIKNKVRIWIGLRLRLVRGINVRNDFEEGMLSGGKCPLFIFAGRT